MTEHRGVSFRSNRQLTNSSYSVIRNHSDIRDHKIFDSGFRILSRVRNRLGLRIVESLYILKERPDNEISIPLYTDD